MPLYDNDPAVARSVAWLLLEHITGKSRTGLVVERTVMLTSAQEHDLSTIFIDLIEKHKPLAYILGTVEFAGLTLTIEPPILIPRPETEEWCMQLIDHLRPLVINAKASEPFTIVDVCTGSGCIALALAHAFPQARVYGLDISPQALQLAEKNAQKLGIANLQFLNSDLLSALDKDLTIDLITANPPYIDPAEFATLEPQVREWEDYTALCAANEGLALIEKLTQTAPKFLTKRYGCGEFWCEMGYNQSEAVVKLYKKTGFSQVSTLLDLAGRARVVRGTIK